jgi:2Fe-2S ferredoxin
MPQITYFDPSGHAITIEVKSGTTVMNGAVKNNVPGIVAECGGACSCATCHVYVDQAWMDRVGPPNDAEASMLEYASHVQPNSRLSCQIAVTAELDGLVVTTPQSQG